MADQTLNTPTGSRWLAYIRERYPVAVYVLLSSGYVLTGWSLTRSAPSALAIVFGVACFMLFFFALRLMDELKDYDKDVIAHPERPLPSGLLSREQARGGINLSMLVMLGLAAAAGLLFSWNSGGLYLLIAAYLWLMYKEFYVGQRLQQFPMVYAVSHQIIGIPMIYFATSLFDAANLEADAVKAASLLTLGAFFAYEVCRKLDPEAHPILKTYLSVYGRGRTFLIVLVAEALAAGAAYWTGVPLLFWVVEALVIASFVLPPPRYKVTETLATLGLLIHLLGLPILRAFGVFHP